MRVHTRPEALRSPAVQASLSSKNASTSSIVLKTFLLVDTTSLSTSSTSCRAFAVVAFPSSAFAPGRRDLNPAFPKMSVRAAVGAGRPSRVSMARSCSMVSGMLAPAGRWCSRSLLSVGSLGYVISNERPSRPRRRIDGMSFSG